MLMKMDSQLSDRFTNPIFTVPTFKSEVQQVEELYRNILPRVSSINVLASVFISVLASVFISVLKS